MAYFTVIKRATLLAAAMLCTGCSNLAYYFQAVHGHLAMMHDAHPIARILVDPQTSPKLKQQLEDVLAIRDFASRELGLPDNQSYRSYADLGRPFAVWNVFAAPELSIEPKQWCLLFVGCVNYRGYYQRADAESLAGKLHNDGWDTFVGGVPAYSTLGFFNDPVLNTFLRYGRAEVARTIFHELAHQKVFVKDDSEFNESYATTVENEGMRRWFATAAHATEEERRAFRLRQQHKVEFAQLVARYHDKLKDLYTKTRPVDQQRQAKAQILAEMRADYVKLKAGWGDRSGTSGYDAWMNKDLNNAKIASFTLYTRLAPAFAALLQAEGGDLPHFYRRVAELAGLGKAERHALLDDLMPDTRLRKIPVEALHRVPHPVSGAAPPAG
jgi:predicted aminopeptidase